ncbi:MAG: XTP/dITP diphosphatase [Thermoplasmata archaeon]|nr:MAG: XTP/dITP diphosphatase [Thermoplasmata archaeon]
MKEISFATTNKGKMLEAEKLLSQLGYQVRQLKISYPEIQASSLQEVATFGIHWIYSEAEVVGAVMLEDAGLFIHALNDFPGPFSKFIFETIGLEGTLKLMEGKKDRSAHFESCFAYAEKGSEPKVFKGRVDGTLASEPRGEHGFGYDPIFVAEGETKTFAEMEIEEKNKHSHRARALQKLVEHLGKR